MNLNDLKDRLMKDEEFRKEHENSEFEYQVKCALIQARIDQKLTQKELAEKIGTKQSNISRFERGNYTPTFEFLQKIVKALGKELKISIV